MDADLSVLLERVARAMESLVPGLMLTPEIPNDGRSIVAAGGDWGRSLGFGIGYRDEYYGAFSHASAGSDREQLLAVTLQLLSDVQDVVSETTTEPWPLAIVNGRKDMAMPDATVEADELLMWYGERAAPVLRLPAVRLT